MELLILASILIGLVIFTAYPLLQEVPFPEVIAQSSGQEELISEKNSIISQLKDVEMDYEMGKLSREDYFALKAQFEGRAIEMLRRLDED